jgi:uncharacterized protein YlxW (UPF0749 family)
VAGATASEDGALRVDRTGGLRDDLAARAVQNVALQAQVDVLAARVVALRGQAPQGPVLERTQEQIDELAPVVGLTEVIGPGVTVTLGDAPVPDVIPDGLSGDDYIVHQEDVQGAVNALWRGGASGVTVMGQRLVSTSAVRCVGNTVILHGRVYSPPFVIAGVGDIASLERALATEPALQFFRDWATVVGLKYDQEASARLTLPPFTGPVSAKYATVVR